MGPVGRRVMANITRLSRDVHAFSCFNQRLSAGGRSIESEYGHQGFVDAPELFSAEVAGAPAQPPDVYGADLLDECAGSGAPDHDLGPERCRSSAAGCW